MENEDPAFQHLRDLHEHPVAKDYFHHMKVVAGFSLPPSWESLFTAYHKHCFEEPTPEFTAGWGPESPNWRWQKLHHESVLGAAQSAATAVFYHVENLLNLERALISFRDLDQLVSLLATSQSCFGGGNTQKLDFEYHGFVFAFRRTLDFLTRGASALLKEEIKSFRDIPKLLNNHSKHSWVSRLTNIHATYAPSLGTFLTSDNSKSVRDQLAHYGHVPAGSLNVNAQGVFFAGGGEALNAEKRLAKVLDQYLRILREVIMQMLSAMTEANPKRATMV